MSAWERSRNIPWSKIPQEGSDLGTRKEKIFRELQREADQQTRLQQQQQQQQQEENGSVPGQDSVNHDKQVASKSAINKIPFTYSDLFRQAAFGGCIGAITGSVFGFMDGMRTAGESPVLKNASNMAKGRYLMQGTTRSATVFGVFFGGFHCLKYGLRVLVDPGEYTEIGIAGMFSMGALMYKPAFRPSVPYASMLIIMDGVHIFMRDPNK